MIYFFSLLVPPVVSRRERHSDQENASSLVSFFFPMSEVECRDVSYISGLFFPPAVCHADTIIHTHSETGIFPLDGYLSQVLSFSHERGKGSK